MASPCSSRSGVSRCSGMPAPTVTVPDVASTSSSRSSRSSRTCTPSAAAISLNECPDPTALTPSPSRTAALTVAATSAVSAGTAIRSGVERTWPLQLCQVMGVVTGRDLRRRIRGSHSVPMNTSPPASRWSVVAAFTVVGRPPSSSGSPTPRSPRPPPSSSASPRTRSGGWPTSSRCSTSCWPSPPASCWTAGSAAASSPGRCSPAVGALLRLAGDSYAWALAGQCLAAIAQPFVLNAITGVAGRYLREEDLGRRHRRRNGQYLRRHGRRLRPRGRPARSGTA